MNAPSFDDLIRSATDRLRAAGIDDARQNAVMLMLGAFGEGRTALIAAGPLPVPETVQAEFEALLARRLARQPVQHITGRAWFHGLEFICDARALIPRFDSECVVEAALARLAEDRAWQVADLGAGTGCLLAALLSERPGAIGVAVEASPEAASLAEENFRALGLSGRAKVFRGSWTDWTGWGEADLIISNPPYIASAAIETLAPEVRDHDPRAALDGGADGLDAYREIIGLGARHMRPGAWLVLETGYDQRDAVSGLLIQSGFENLQSGQDLGGQDRWLAAIKARSFL